MKNTTELHETAMLRNDEAFVARLRGDLGQARALFEQAYESEREAALQLLEDFSAEPSRSVLLRSAASLALDCEKYREAERLIAEALRGEPPTEIAEELRDLLEQVNFKRHLEIRGITLVDGDLQISIAGNSVGFGIAPNDEFLNRVRDTEKMIFRTAERKMKLPFREAGQPDRAVRDAFELFVGTPAAASFAVKLQVGKRCPVLPGIDVTAPGDVIDTILGDLEAYNQADDRLLKERIAEEAYYRNFCALAKNLSPDGHRVSSVNFVARRNQESRHVQLTRTRSKHIPSASSREPETVTISGKLLQADGTRRNDEIGVVDEAGKKHNMRVPQGMLNDIVRPLWGEPVVVSAMKTGKALTLVEIDKASED